MCEYNGRKENQNTEINSENKTNMDTNSSFRAQESDVIQSTVSEEAENRSVKEEAAQDAPAKEAVSQATADSADSPAQGQKKIPAQEQTVKESYETNAYAYGANPENYTTYAWSARNAQQHSAAQDSVNQTAASGQPAHTAYQQQTYQNSYASYQHPGATGQTPYQQANSYQAQPGQTPYQQQAGYTQHPYQHPYQQTYQTAAQPAAHVKKKKEKKPKQPKERFLTKKAAAVFMALCIVVAGGVGVGGGILGYRLGNQNNSSASSSLNLNLGGTPATPTASNGSELSIAEITAKAQNSVVEIVTEGVVTNNFMQQFIQKGAGSGIIIDANGYIVTNNHVIDGADKISVTLKNGESYDATLIGTDSESDVALIKIDATNLQPVTVGDSSTLQVGETAVAIGNPLGQLGGTVTNGIVSALDRQITIDGQTMTLLQTNAAINPGNSGGGLFNGNGELIGMVVAKSSSTEDGTAVEGLGFAIPVNTVKEVAEQLQQYGYVKGRVQLGVSLLNITTAQQAMMYRVGQPGVYIQQVTVDSAAEKAGLQIGDCILSVEGTDVKTADEVKAVLQNYNVGDTILITVLRNNREVSAEVTLQESVPNDTSNSKPEESSWHSNGGFPFGN